MYLTNKEMVGAHFTLIRGLTDPNEAKTVMAGVASAPASLRAQSFPPLRNIPLGRAIVIVAS